MKARTLYWLIVSSGMITTIISSIYLIHNQWIPWIGFAVTLTLVLCVVLKHSPEDEIQFSKQLKTQLIRWFWYNLLIFPVLMAFYIPYNIFWLNYTPLQILKFIATNGFFGAIVNFILRPWNAWIARFIERRNKKPEALKATTSLIQNEGEKK